MEASRKLNPDAIPSDTLTRRIWGEGSEWARDLEADMADRHTQGEDYARVLHVIALARAPLVAQDCRWLYDALYNAVLQLVQNLDPTLSPLDSYVVDADTTREMVKLYGDKTRFMDDERALDLDEGRIGTNGLYDFEGR